MRTPDLASLLLGTRDPDRLHQWYGDAFGVEPDIDGFLHFGRLAVLIVPRDDVGPSAAEPGRVLLNYEVGDIEATFGHLTELGAPVVAPVEHREDGGAWFATVADPDGNFVQIIQLTP